MSRKFKPVFMPELHVPPGTFDLSFYTNAFDAEVLRSFDNKDGSVHATEMSINGAMFIIHEENVTRGRITPAYSGGSTITIGLLVDDVDSVMAKAITAGAKETVPAEDFDYGYRQGEILDPFGHRWIIKSLYKFCIIAYNNAFVLLQFLKIYTTE